MRTGGKPGKQTQSHKSLVKKQTLRISLTHVDSSGLKAQWNTFSQTVQETSTSTWISGYKQEAWLKLNPYSDRVADQEALRYLVERELTRRCELPRLDQL